ncbi:hypothetical protein GE118_00450 [Mycoplasma sp. NEAQ87857]|uniref:hypothetical protein n=1 Tax=Mycoplasma sp. NEAQ87857 TaxID=2683967 RepID=UPI001316F517|nr:hypothetical protein [Mycoplasma sp. NEAQ87857]QGZ97274.1 hypothetical protein GE118_00450 [Mycoplasma sp. NEAQ87857]
MTKNIKKLIVFLESLKDNELIINCDDWKEVELKIKELLTKNGFVETSFDILKSQSQNNIAKKIKRIKQLTTNKNNIFPIKNIFFKELKLNFIYIPFGIQEFPDFILFIDDIIFPLEIKTSNHSNTPSFNTNLPKSNSIYIFKTKKNITYFFGENILSNRNRVLLNKYLNIIQESQKLMSLIEQLKTNNDQENLFGLKPYARIFFKPSLEFSTLDNFTIFDTKITKTLENNTKNTILNIEQVFKIGYPKYFNNIQND